MARITSWGLNIYVRFIDYASRAFHLLTGKIGQLGETSEDVQEKLKDLSKSLKANITAAAGLGFAAVKLGGWFFGLAKEAGKVEYQITMLGGILGKTDAKFQELTKAIRENTLGLTEWRPEVKGKAAVELARAGLSARECLEVLPPVLDLMTAGQLDVVKATRLVTHAMRAFGLTTEETTALTDKLAWVAMKTPADLEFLVHAFGFATRAAAITNENLDEMLIALGLLAPIMRTGSKAGTSFARALIRMYSSAKEVRDAVKALNLSLVDSEGRQKSLLELTIDLSRALKGQAAQTRINIAEQILQTRGMAMLAAVERAAAAGGKEFADRMVYAADAIKVLREGIGKAEGFLKGLANRLRQTYEIQLKMFHKAVNELQILLGEQFLPACKGIITLMIKVMEVIKTVNSWAGGLFTTFLKFGVMIVFAKIVLKAFKFLFGAVKDFREMFKLTSKRVVEDSKKMESSMKGVEKTTKTSMAAASTAVTKYEGTVTRAEKTSRTFFGRLKTGLRGMKLDWRGAGAAALWALPAIATELTTAETASDKLLGSVDAVATSMLFFAPLFGKVAGGVWLLGRAIVSAVIQWRENIKKMRQEAEVAFSLMEKMLSDLRTAMDWSVETQMLWNVKHAESVRGLIAMAYALRENFGAQKAQALLQLYLAGVNKHYTEVLGRSAEELARLSMAIVNQLLLRGKEIEIIGKERDMVKAITNSIMEQLKVLKERELITAKYAELAAKYPKAAEVIIPAVRERAVPTVKKTEVHLILGKETISKIIEEYNIDTDEVSLKTAEEAVR